MPVATAAQIELREAEIRRLLEARVQAKTKSLATHPADAAIYSERGTSLARLSRW